MTSNTRYQRQVLIATSLSYVVVILDTSIVNVAVESISRTFGSGITGLQWVINAYTLTFASLLLTGGLLGDRFGAKKIYAVGSACLPWPRRCVAWPPTCRSWSVRGSCRGWAPRCWCRVP